MRGGGWRSCSSSKLLSKDLGSEKLGGSAIKAII